MTHDDDEVALASDVFALFSLPYPEVARRLAELPPGHVFARALAILQARAALEGLQASDATVRAARYRLWATVLQLVAVVVAVVAVLVEAG